MKALWLMLLAAPLAAQVPNPSIVLVSTAPSGSCTGGLPDQQVITTGVIYSCQNSTWTAFTSGASTSSVPANLQFLGDGSDGAFTCPSGTCTISTGEHWYSSFNISNGATVTQTGTGQTLLPMVIRSTGTCTIAGTLSFNGAIFAANWGGGGGGGGGGTGAGVVGAASFGNNGGGTAGAASGGNGGNGTLTPVASSQRILLTSPGGWGSIISTASTLGFGGAQGGAGGSSGPGGALGGGMIVIACPTINFTGTITAQGANGGNSTGNNVGASGGGCGGIVILRSPALTNSGTINVNGGSGGSCLSFTGCGTGGSGANGWTYVLAK